MRRTGVIARSVATKKSSCLKAGLLRFARNDGSLGAFAQEAMCQHLAQNAAPDRLVGRRRISPPPAVVLHRPRGGNEPVGHGFEIGFSVIEAEDQPPAA